MKGVNILRDDIMVSIRCLCYNHEKYLRRSLDGIVNQKTNFRFEAIIHDDASTDNSQAIIKEYAEKYPEIIIPILQKENQYSKDPHISQYIIRPIVRGKYCAICECDDYWTDLNKLQQQVDFLEKHSEYSICGHAYDVVEENEHIVNHKIRENKQNHDISLNDIIMNYDLPQTATLVYRTDKWMKMPDFFSKCMVGDYPLMLYMGTCGKMFYINKNMSCYRLHDKGSWVSETRKNPIEFRTHVDLLINMLVEYNKYTFNKYKNIVDLRISQCDYIALSLEEKITEIKHNKYFLTLPFKERAAVISKLKYPKAASFFKRVIKPGDKK